MSDPFIAEIVMFAGNFNPRGWAFCSGQLLPISQNTALFSLLGTTFGGDGRVTFGLPDLRGRVPVGAHGSAGPGLAQVPLGSKGGAVTHTLTVAQLPSHSHNYTPRASSDDAASDDPENAYHGTGDFYHGTSDVNMGQSTTLLTGGGQAFNIRQPYQGINFIIALQGLFPSRN